MGETETSELRKDGHCFVCGPENERGFQASFAIDRENHTAQCRMILPDWTQGWKSVAHGGVLATLLDEASVHAARTLGPLPVTAELTVKYLRPVRVGSEVRVFASVVDMRKRIVEVRATLEVGGETHAEASAKVFLMEEAP